MNPLAIRQFPDPLLKQPTRPVGRVSGPVQHLVERLIATMHAHPHCVGLAAPQVGSRYRLAVMDATGHPKAPKSRGLIVLIDPQLLAAEGQVLQREGCLSIPDFTGNVRRAQRVHLNALDQFGAMRELWLEGFEAVIAQHELDHLEGRLFLDRVANVRTDVFRRKSYS